ncbi:MAG: geranylgeranylglyceryl/heptaprenylglyceryl phosphate synthase [Acidilobaceae archaeon]|nr:geranylgeranylglyceryl/heptaprenylglyceryl phosphate synthase [Acidilobaceae archaeon]
MGKIWRSMLERRKESRLHFTLIDPDKTEPWEAEKIARAAREYGTDYVLVGGSLGVSPQSTDIIVEVVKREGLPVIIFPGSLNNVSPKADAALFLNIINSDDPYYHGIAQVQGSLIVLRHGLEPIPTCYVIVGYGGTAGYMARARPIPYEKPELVAAHALACAMMGSKVIYLEAGSGAPRPVPPEAVFLSKEFLKAVEMEALLIVGGGIRSAEVAKDMARAGADGIVTGNIVEQNPEALREIVKAFKEG